MTNLHAFFLPEFKEILKNPKKRVSIGKFCLGGAFTKDDLEEGEIPVRRGSAYRPDPHHPERLKFSKIDSDFWWTIEGDHRHPSYLADQICTQINSFDYIKTSGSSYQISFSINSDKLLESQESGETQYGYQIFYGFYEDLSEPGDLKLGYYIFNTVSSTAPTDPLGGQNFMCTDFILSLGTTYILDLTLPGPVSAILPESGNLSSSNQLLESSESYGNVFSGSGLLGKESWSKWVQSEKQTDPVEPEFLRLNNYGLKIY